MLTIELGWDGHGSTAGGNDASGGKKDATAGGGEWFAGGHNKSCLLTFSSSSISLFFIFTKIISPCQHELVT